MIRSVAAAVAAAAVLAAVAAARTATAADTAAAPPSSTAESSQAQPAPTPAPAAPSPAGSGGEQPPPAAAPPEEKGAGMVTLDHEDALGLIGKKITSRRGEDMGRIVNVVVDRDGRVRAAVIDFGGFLGVGNRRVAVDWNALRFSMDGKVHRITLDLTRNEVKAAPEYKDSDNSGDHVVIVAPAGTPGTDAAAAHAPANPPAPAEAATPSPPPAATPAAAPPATAAPAPGDEAPPAGTGASSPSGSGGK